MATIVDLTPVAVAVVLALGAALLAQQLLMYTLSLALNLGAFAVCESLVATDDIAVAYTVNLRYISIVVCNAVAVGCESGLKGCLSGGEESCGNVNVFVVVKTSIAVRDDDHCEGKTRKSVSEKIVSTELSHTSQTKNKVVHVAIKCVESVIV